MPLIYIERLILDFMIMLGNIVIYVLLKIGYEWRNLLILKNIIISFLLE